ncbi:MAG: protein kinase domain-containing protein, partial [Turicibacter sp.]
GDYKQQPFIVMEYVKGKTLKDFIRENGKADPELAVAIMKQLGAGVNYAHENKIIHRDLKTQNIMITDDHLIKITDFGIALSSNEADITQTNTIMGSVHYLAPELARGNLATERSDIYALGIIFYELLVGEVPFKGEGAVNIALQHLEADMPSIKLAEPELPNSLDNIIKCATSKKPMDRYQNVRDMEADINTALEIGRVDEPLRTDVSIVEDLDNTIMMPNLEKEVSEEMAKKKTKTKKKNKAFGVLNTSLVVVYAVFLIMAMFMYYIIIYEPAHFKAEEVRVPDVVTLTVDQARMELEELGLDNSKVIEIEDSNYKEGDVFKTMPSVGTRVKVKSDITLYVAKKPSKATISNVPVEPVEENDTANDENNGE